MKNTHRTTFQVCKDNAAAAKELTRRLVEAGIQATADGDSVDHEGAPEVFAPIIDAVEKAAAKSK